MTNQTWINKGGLSLSVKSLERVSLNEGPETCGGCLWPSFSGSFGGVPVDRFGETEVLIYAQKPFIARHSLARRPCQLLAIPLNSEHLKGPHTGLGAFLPSSSSHPVPLPSLVFLFCCPQQPQQLVLEWREQARLPRRQAVVAEQFTGATQRNRFL